MPPGPPIRRRSRKNGCDPRPDSNRRSALDPLAASKTAVPCFSRGRPPSYPPSPRLATTRRPDLPARSAVKQLRTPVLRLPWRYGPYWSVPFLFRRTGSFFSGAPAQIRCAVHRAYHFPAWCSATQIWQGTQRNKTERMNRPPPLSSLPGSAMSRRTSRRFSARSAVSSHAPPPDWGLGRPVD